MVNIRELAKMDAKLIEDRNVVKWSVNLTKDGRMFGFMKPVVDF